MASSQMRLLARRLGLSLLLMATGSALGSEDDLQPLRNVLDPILESTFIPGYLITTFDAGGHTAEASAGITRDDSRSLPREDSIFAITWMAEPIISMAIARLVQQDRLSLDEEVMESFSVRDGDGSRVLEAPEPLRAPTIKDLLRHTAGIQAKAQERSYNGSRQGVAKGVDISIEKLVSSNGQSSLASVAEELVANASAQDGLFRYSHSYEILGRIIEIKTELPLDEALKDLVFDPLEMQDTFFQVPVDEQGRIAQLYTNRIPTYPVPGQFRLIQPHPAFPAGQQNIGAQSFSWKSPTLGLLSTAQDLQKFLQLLSNDFTGPNGKPFLEKKLGDQFFFTDQLGGSFGPDPLVSSFGRHGEGLSFSLASAMKLKDDGSREIDYIFWWGLANTLFWFIPDQKLAGIVLTQHEPAQYNLIEELVSASKNL